MKRIATKKNSVPKRILINIPFIFIVAAIIACLGGGALLFFYSVVCAVAFCSAMIYLIVAGASAILLSAGLGFIVLYRKYYSFYNKKMGWIIQKKSNDDAVTKTERKSFKDYLTLPNFSLAILAIGAVFTIISAVLGCTDRSKWVDAISSFREYNGYYSDIQNPQIQYPISASDNDIAKIEIDLIDKIAVVVYTDDAEKQGFIIINAYTKFENHLVTARSKDGVVTITENPSPKRNETLDRLLFFVFDDFSVEKQVLVYVPQAYKDDITVEGEKIIYPEEDKNDSENKQHAS